MSEGCTSCGNKGGCDSRKHGMFAAVDEALARLYPDAALDRARRGGGVRRGRERGGGRGPRARARVAPQGARDPSPRHGRGDLRLRLRPVPRPHTVAARAARGARRAARGRRATSRSSTCASRCRRSRASRASSRSRCARRATSRRAARHQRGAAHGRVRSGAAQALPGARRRARRARHPAPRLRRDPRRRPKASTPPTTPSATAARPPSRTTSSSRSPLPRSRRRSTGASPELGGQLGHEPRADGLRAPLLGRVVASRRRRGDLVEEALGVGGAILVEVAAREVDARAQVERVDLDGALEVPLGLVAIALRPGQLVEEAPPRRVDRAAARSGGRAASRARGARETCPPCPGRAP